MSDATQKRSGWVRQAVDFGALVAFAGTFAFLRVVRKLEGDEALVQATWVLMGASAVALVVGWLVEKRLAWMPALTGGAALVFGGLTVLFHDPSIIKMKVTVLNAVFAAVLFGSLALGRNPAKALLGESIDMPDQAWRVLTIRYGLFFVACAVANEVIWRTQSNDVWMWFKGGLFAASLVFAVANVPFMMKHMRDKDGPAMPEPPDTGL